MSAPSAPLNRQTASRFLRAVRDLLNSEVRRRAIALLILLLVFALAVNGLNVVNSYVGRDFMTAISRQDMGEFIRLAIVYIGVFAASTAVAVFYRFCEERLGLLWRSWLTKRVTTLPRSAHLSPHQGVGRNRQPRPAYRRGRPGIYDHDIVIYAHVLECDAGGHIVLGRNVDD
jgi:ABC transporter transmembrane region 2